MMHRLLTVLVVALAMLVAPHARAALLIVEALPIAIEGGNGHFSLRNDGPSPVRVGTMLPREGDLPPTVVVTLEQAGKPIAPGEVRKATVKWERPPTRSIAGNVIVETSDRPVGPANHWLSVPLAARVHTSPLVELLPVWLCAIPLGAAFAAVILARVRRDERLVRWLALGASGLHVAAALLTLRTFDASVTRADGNAGYQFVLRGARGAWWLGVDGASMPWLVVIALVGLVCVAASFPVERHLASHLAGLLAALGFATLAVVALDGALLLVSVAGAVAATAVLVSDGTNGRAVIRVWLNGALAVVALAVGLFALRRHADPAWLLDGSRVTSFALPDLARTDWLAASSAGAYLFSAPIVKGAFVAVVIAAIALLRLAPIHGSGDTLAEIPTAGAIVLTTVLPIIGLSVLVRVGVQIVPAGARWAAPGLAFLAAATVVWCAVVAAGEAELQAVAGRLASVHAGIAVLALVAFTPQGIAAAVAHLSTSALSTAMLLFAVGLVERRLGTTATARLGGLAAESSRLGLLSVVALVASAAAPGTAVFATAGTALVGAFPVHRAATAIAALGLGLAAIAVASHWRRAFRGAFPESWRKSPLLEPFGGKFPELDAREHATLLALAVVIVTLGVAPYAMFELSRGFVDDISARLNGERIG